MKMINGILLINKDINRTSRDMINDINHIFSMKKVGHTGTLDPLATGVLVVLLGRYTKCADVLSSLKKEYIASVKLGIKTDTLDITGNVIEEQKCILDKEKLKEVFKSLKGKQIQEIPLYSAKKIKGKKLYEYARSSLDVELPKNEIEIFEIELLDVKDASFSFRCIVSKGTYIRSLIESICTKLDIIGIMSSLVRTKQGQFSINDSYTIDDIKNNNYKILKLKDILDYPIYNLNDNEYQKVLNGCPLIIDAFDEYVILCYQDREIALYKKNNEEYKMNVLLELSK